MTPAARVLPVYIDGRPVGSATSQRGCYFDSASGGPMSHLPMAADREPLVQGSVTNAPPNFGLRIRLFADSLHLSLPAWHTRDRKTLVLFWTLVGVSTLLAAAGYTSIVGLMVAGGATYVHAVFLFWGWSKFVHVISPTSLIYHAHTLYAFEQGLTGAPRINLPFAYPPPLLLLIWPLALLPPVAALGLWLGTSLGLYLWACWHRPWRPLTAALALVAPSTIATCGAAQISLLSAALMIGGCRLVGRRPVLAGVLFGLLALKPQLGLLVPIALLSAREWRSLVAGAATALLSVLVSGAAFGWASWTQLPQALVGLSHVVADYPGFDRLSPTVTSGLRMLGATPTLTHAAQLATAVCVIVTIWFAFRRGFTALPAAALMVGTFLVTPYAWYCDLPMASYAVLPFVIDRHRSGEPFRSAELIALVLVAFLPVLMAPHVSMALQRLPVPWGMTALALFFGLIVRQNAITSRTAGCGSS